MMKLLSTALLLSIVACVDAPPPGARTCEEIHDVETYELTTDAGPLWCIANEVPHGATKFLSSDLLEPVPPGTGRFYVGPERYYTELDNPVKVGVLVRLSDGGCAWVQCDGGINPIDAGMQ